MVVSCWVGSMGFVAGDDTIICSLALVPQLFSNTNLTPSRSPYRCDDKDLGTFLNVGIGLFRIQQPDHQTFQCLSFYILKRRQTYSLCTGKPDHVSTQLQECKSVCVRQPPKEAGSRENAAPRRPVRPGAPPTALPTAPRRRATGRHDNHVLTQRYW